MWWSCWWLSSNIKIYFWLVCFHEIFLNALHTNDDILFYNEDFDKVTFIANNRHILVVDLEKINLDNNNNS